MTEERRYAILFCCDVVVCEETEQVGLRQAESGEGGCG